MELFRPLFCTEASCMKWECGNQSLGCIQPASLVKPRSLALFAVPFRSFPDSAGVLLSPAPCAFCFSSLVPNDSAVQ
jgi:hypothetical protein